MRILTTNLKISTLTSKMKISKCPGSTVVVLYEKISKKLYGYKKNSVKFCLNELGVKLVNVS